MGSTDAPAEEADGNGGSEPSKDNRQLGVASPRHLQFPFPELTRPGWCGKGASDPGPTNRSRKAEVFKKPQVHCGEDFRLALL